MPPVNLVHERTGERISVADDPMALALAAEKGFRREQTGDIVSAAAAAEKERRTSGVIPGVMSGLTSFAGGATLGLSDAVIAKVGAGSDAAQNLSDIREAHRGPAIVGDIAGTIASGGTNLPGGLAAKAGARVARTAEGAGTLARIGRGAAGGAVEGAIVGAGQGVSELALSKDPLTVERIASSLSSNALFGAATGGAVGGAGKTLEIGLGRAKKAIDDFRVRGETADSLPDDLANMDVKQLRAARDVELDSIKTARAAEKETVEQARVVERQKIADDLRGHHDALELEKPWLATKDATEKEVRTIGKQLFNANKPLRNMLDNPKYLAERPQQALQHLQKQEHALDQMLRIDGRLRTTFAAEESVARAAALDTVPAVLERNRALQARIRESIADVKLATPEVSPRLQQIDEARELLAAGKGDKSIAEQMLTGSVFSGVAGLASAIPLVGPMLAPLVGARAAKLVGETVFGGAGKAANAVAKRGARAVDALLTASKHVSRLAPPLATKTLAAVRYAAEEKATTTQPKRPNLATLYHARSKELRSQTMYAQDGSIQMRPETRAQVASRLDPIRAVDPIAADQLETIAARRVEFLASKLPRRPDIGGMPLSASDRWQPSEMEMRQFARYAAAVEDPMGIVERVADGTVTPSDTEVMKQVYPEMYADIASTIMSRLPELRTSLPYRQRLALSRFTGEAVDASMHPRILGVLQLMHATEPSTDGGQHAPTPQPQFGALGSIPKRAEQNQTPSQRRAV